MKITKRSFLTFFCLIVCFFGNAYSQSKQTEIQSLTIKTQLVSGNPQSSLLITTNEFSDSAGIFWGPVWTTQCFPCESGDSLGSGFSSNQGLRFSRSVGQGRARYYEFTNTTATSPAIRIPYFYPRNREISIIKPSSIGGTLKIYEMDSQTGSNRVELYNLNVSMSGTAQFNFAPLQTLTIRGGLRYTNFRRASYNYFSRETSN